MIITQADNIDEQIVELRMIVACDYNANGEPDFYFCKVRCTRKEYNLGDHYSVAERQAIENDFGGKMVSMDEHDSGGRNMLDKFEWDTASTFTV